MNKRTLSMITAGLAVISGIITAALWFELHKEQARNAALPTPAAATVGSRVDAAPQADVIPQQVEAPPPAAAPTTTPVAAPVLVSSAVITQKDLMSDPDFRKGRLAMLRSSLQRTYPGLAEALHLTPAEAEKFFDLVSDTQMSLMDLRADVAEQANNAQGELTQKQEGERWRNRETIQRRQADGLRSLLGDDRYQQWLSYEPSRVSRMQAGTFATALSDGGTPLDAAQMKIFESAVATEDRSLTKDTVAIGRTINSADPQSQSLAQDALKKRREESSQHILDTTSAYLSAQQLKVLRTHIEEQAALRRAMDDARQRAREIQAQTPQ